MANLTPEQLKNARRIIEIGRSMGASPKVLKSALETGLVESNLRNLHYGDRDSTGIFQQRKSQGWPGGGVDSQARAYFQRALQNAAQAGSSGQLAQSVQRSAFPDRYDQRGKDAQNLLRGIGGNTGGAQLASYHPSASTSTSSPDNSAVRQAIVQNFLASPERPGAMLQLALGISQAQDTPPAPGSPPEMRGPNRPGTANASLIDIGKLGQKMGLHVGGNAAFDGKNPTSGHAPNSYHYQGRAIDVSGDPGRMQKFAALVKQRYGKSLKELFWNGPGAKNIKNGQSEPKNFVSGHTDHVHVAK